jgi:hypothetical protein
MPPVSWAEWNQRHLLAAGGALRVLVERSRGADGRIAFDRAAVDEYRRARAAAEEAAPVFSAVRELARSLRLSSFEQDVVLLCAAVEVDPQLAVALAPPDGRPTLAFALGLLAGADWGALSPGAPLLRYRVVVPCTAGDSWLRAPVRLDDPVLAYVLGGVPYDERVWDQVDVVAVPEGALPASYQKLAGRMTAHLGTPDTGAGPVVLQLSGSDLGAQRAIAARASADAGLVLAALRATDVPASAADRSAFARLWERQAALGSALLLLEIGEASEEESRGALAFAEILGAPLIVASREPVFIRRPGAVRIEVRSPPAAEQVELWSKALPSATACTPEVLERVAAQFQGGWEAAAAAAGVLRDLVTTEPASDPHGPGDQGGPPADVGEVLWEACRVASRRRIDGLAARISSVARWEDLVLPPANLGTLREITAQLRQRTRVYEHWGFAARCSERGLGVSALFYGESGTGKTLAAEVIANELHLDLFRVDLSRVVSKYIGETEKNLRRVFDAAEESGAVLLFDEADALFGRRSEVRDSHDRYANIEVSYLLARMETYRGLAILTTNFRHALDPAFLRRIRFVVHFPVPDTAQRAAIWERIFPAAVPTRGLNPAQLARLSVTGGVIRNIALGAAFLAADAGEPVTPAHIMRAAATEYAKHDRSVSEAETRGVK